MPEYTGSTDEKHVFTLPSEIERVRWRRSQAAPKGKVGLQIRTIFCAQGSQMEIRLEDAQGTVHNTISGELPGDTLNLSLRVPENAVGGLLAKVRMPNHGLSAESEALRIVNPVRPFGARWSTDTVKRGEIVDLTTEVRGAPDGRRAMIRLFQQKRGAPVPLTHIQQRVEKEAVQAKYRFQYPGDTSDILPEWNAPEGYRQPEFFYTVDVSGRIADSQDAKTRGVMTFVDDLDLRLLDAGTHAPLTDQTAKVTLPDGSTQEKSLDGEGRVRLREVPPGPVRVQLPEYTPPTDGDHDASGGVPDGATSFTMQTQDSSVEVATGGEETVYVVPPQIDVYLEQGLVGIPLDGTDYELTVKTEDGTTATFEGTIGDEGRLRQAVPLGAIAAVLLLESEAGTVELPIELTRLAESENATGLQQRLAQFGLYDGKIDGEKGPVTRAEIQSLQDRMGSSVTGTIPEDERPMLDGIRFRNA